MNACLLFSSDKTINPITYLNSTKEFYMIATPILRNIAKSRLSSTAYKLWTVLGDLAKKTKSLTCAYARPILGKMINRSVRTITSVVAELEFNGLVQVERKYCSPTRKEVNVYTLTIPNDLKEEAEKTSDRKKPPVFQPEERSAAMEGSKETRNSYVAYGPLPQWFSSLSIGGDSAENCTIDKKEDLKNNNNNEKQEVAYSVPVLSEVKTVPDVSPLLKDVKKIMDEEKDKEFITVENSFQKYFTERYEACAEDIQTTNRTIGEIRIDIKNLKENPDDKVTEILNLTLKEKYMVEDINKMIDYKKIVDKLRSNKATLYMLSSIVYFYYLYKKFHINKNKLQMDEFLENDPFKKHELQNLCIASNMKLDEIKSKIRNHQHYARLTFYLADPCYVGHDLKVHYPQIPKNVLMNYFNLVEELVEKEKACEIFNEMAASVRFGELSRCSDENGIVSFKKGFNVALKLLREGRWKTPKCVSVVNDMIQYSEMNIIFKDAEGEEINLFHEVNCQLDSMGLST